MWFLWGDNRRGGAVMIYVPMLKTRDEELRVLRSTKECFSDKIIPLVEVISEKYQVRYEVDENGEFIRELHGKQMRKVPCKPTEQDIITLQKLNELVGDHKFFVDYFRFSLEKYGANIKFASAELAFRISNDYELYKKKVISVTEYENMIPVISVKPQFEIPKSELRNFIEQLQNSTEQVALRITEELVSTYSDIICNLLRKDDYLLFDVEEQNPETKFMEIEGLKELEAKCNIVLLNSPRKVSIKNGEYPEHDKTDLINNCAREIAASYDLLGYGDYCGLKDVMPLNSGPTTTGAALALFYDFAENVFYSYCNHDTSLGMKGYGDIIPVIESDEEILNPDGDCLGFEKMNNLDGNGNWSTWHYINAVRYIHQTSKYL